MFCSIMVQTFPFFQQSSDVVPQRDVGYSDPKDHAWFLSSHLLGMVGFQHLQLLRTLLTIGTRSTEQLHDVPVINND